MGWFHKHIWKEEKEEFLREYYKDVSHYLSLYPHWRKYGALAVTYKCVVCGKTKVKEKEVLIV